MKKSYNLLAVVLLVFLLGVFLEETIDSSKSSNYESLEKTFEILSELFSVFVAFSIFSITWHAYNKSRDNHSLFVGTTFLITGILILCHLLSYPFMPDFITPNSSHKASVFFLESRFILAFLLLASIYVHNSSFPKLINKHFIILSASVIFSFAITSVFLYHDSVFGSFDLDSYSAFTVSILLLITVIILATSYLYDKRAKETSQINLYYLANGSIIILFSNLVYFSYEFSGHFLIITGFLYFYIGLYKSSVELPYERLAISEENLRRAAQEKYRRLFEDANDAVVTIDTDGCVTSWNKSAQKLFGWTAEEITGKRLFETLATPGTEVQKEKMTNELPSETVTGQETSCMHKDGTRLNVSFTISPLMDVEGKVKEMSLIIRDITERKKYEQTLRKSEEFSRTILNSMNDGIMVIDAYDLGILRMNSYLLKKYGLNEKEVIGKKCFEISHKITEPCYRRNEICPLLETVGTGKYSMVEHVHFGRNNEKIYVEVSTSPIKDDTGKVVQIIHVTRDITERKKAENALQASKVQLTEAQRIARIGNWELDIVKNTLSWSDEIFRIFELNKEHFGASYEAFLDAIHPDDRDAVHAAYTQSLESRKPYEITHRLLMRDGRIKYVQEQCETFYSSDGKPLRSVGTIQDITNSWLAEEKIKKSLEEKEVLLREIHHRVKNNMQIISSLLMLQSQNIEEKKYRDLFIESQTRIHSMALIHEKLYRSVSIAQINFKEYIEDIVSNIFESYSMKKDIKIDINVENIPIKIDYAVPCGLIINELVTNSLKYAFPGERQGKIQISLNTNDNNMIILSISDDGIGIPQDMDIRNTKSLGLHLVTALAEGQLHGKIILNRESGTEFQISFGAK